LVEEAGHLAEEVEHLVDVVLQEYWIAEVVVKVHQVYQEWYRNYLVYLLMG
jgi:hypothetical protein